MLCQYDRPAHWPKSEPGTNPADVGTGGGSLKGERN
jgi:hypothetical protein